MYRCIKKDLVGCIKLVLKLKIFLLICGTVIVWENAGKIHHFNDIGQKRYNLSGIVNDADVSEYRNDMNEDKDTTVDDSDMGDKPIISLEAVEEAFQAYIFEDENETDTWINSPIKLKLTIHEDNGISNVSVKIGDREPEVTDYSDVVNETEELKNTEDNIKDIEKYITIEESAVTSAGVVAQVVVTNILGEVSEYTRFVHVDTNLPAVVYTDYENISGSMAESNEIVYSKEKVCVRFLCSDSESGIDPTSIRAVYEPSNIPLPVSVDDRGYYTYFPSGEEQSLYDGCVVVYAKDMAGNDVEQRSKRIVYCNSEPQIIWSSDYEFGKWIDTDVTIHIECAARECGIKKIDYYVAGKRVYREEFDDIRYISAYDLKLDKTAEKKSGYTVEVRLTDNCGNETRKKDKVYIDKEAPKLSLTGAANGMYYSDNINMRLDISDVSFADTVLACEITRTVDGNSYKENRDIFIPNNYTDSNEFVLFREGEYRINVAATDGAGNKTVLSELNFVIDKTPPEIYIGGVNDKTVKNTDVKLDFVCEESFFDTSDISINVKRSKGGKSVTERLNIFEHNRKKEVKHYTFSNDGEYEITMEAKDKAGNEAVQELLHFTLDKTAPDITFIGTDPYKQWDKQVEVKVTVMDDICKDNRVSIRGYMSGIDGKKTGLLRSQMEPDKKDNNMTFSFEKDGLYELCVNARDDAGNISRKDIQFLIDTKPPEIKGIVDFDGKYLKELDIQDKKDNIFSDLTLRSCGLFLNGIEYDGMDKITQEGKYTLSAYAEDELGHRSQVSAEFIIDNSAPDILFNGIKNGDVVYESGVLEWRTYDADDKITGVLINGKEYDANKREMSYNTYGAYDIEISSVDKAGNEGVSKLSFEYAAPRKEKTASTDIKADKSNRAIAVVILGIILSVFGGLIVYVLKKRVVKSERYKND